MYIYIYKSINLSLSLIIYIYIYIYIYRGVRTGRPICGQLREGGRPGPGRFLGIGENGQDQGSERFGRS